MKTKEEVQGILDNMELGLHYNLSVFIDGVCQNIKTFVSPLWNSTTDFRIIATEKGRFVVNKSSGFKKPVAEVILPEALLDYSVQSDTTLRQFTEEDYDNA